MLLMPPLLPVICMGTGVKPVPRGVNPRPKPAPFVKPYWLSINMAAAAVAAGDSVVELVVPGLGVLGPPLGVLPGTCAEPLR